MHKLFLVSALLGSALAIPRPQEIALEEIETLPTPSLVTPAVAVASQTASILPLASQVAAASSALSLSPPSASSTLAAKRSRLEGRDGTCMPQLVGSGPVSKPDTVKAFLQNKDLKSLSNSASTPYGYKRTFQGLNAAVTALNYMGLFTLTSYDTLGCASKCDQASGCVAFNIYAGTYKSSCSFSMTETDSPFLDV